MGTKKWEKPELTILSITKTLGLFLQGPGGPGGDPDDGMLPDDKS